MIWQGWGFYFPKRGYHKEHLRTKKNMIYIYNYIYDYMIYIYIYDIYIHIYIYDIYIYIHIYI